MKKAVQFNHNHQDTKAGLISAALLSKGCLSSCVTKSHTLKRMDVGITSALVSVTSKVFKLNV